MKANTFILALLFALSSCGGMNTNNQNAADSAVTGVAVDSTYMESNSYSNNEVPETRRDSIISAISHKYRIESDEFSDNDLKYYIPKSAPKYRNQNGFYCYFSTNGKNKVNSFRFVLQYENDDWLFMNSCVFNIDGENYPYTPLKPLRDHDSRIWEWFDEYIDAGNIYLIRKIANAKSVKVKINGNQYYDTRTMKAREIEVIRETLDDYENLGGKFY